MNNITFTSIRRGLGLLIPVSLLVFIGVTGCTSLQEIRAKESLQRAGDAYSKAKANPNVEAYAPALVTEAGYMIQEARQAKSFVEMEQLGYLAEKKSQTALSIAEGKVVEKEIETLRKEEADVLMQKRLLEAKLAKTEAEAKAREAEQARSAAAREAATAEKSKKEAEQSRASALAEAEKAERSKKEAEQARSSALAEAEKAEKARMEAEARAREAEQTKAEVDQFLKELSELQGKMTERGIVLTMGDVLFAFGKADLASGAVRNVDKLAAFLEKHPKRNVLIEGHTDSVGSDEFNQTLSQKRADAVKEVLTAKGVSPDRILTKGYGKQFPVASNDTESGRQLNRRVEVLILNEGINPESAVR
jgi:outer membrane protein OmpA-like peptidoglycan-associated protein